MATGKDAALLSLILTVGAAALVATGESQKCLSLLPSVRGRSTRAARSPGDTPALPEELGTDLAAEKLSLNSK